MTKAALAKAVGDVARAMASDAELHRLLWESFVYLAETLAAVESDSVQATPALEPELTTRQEANAHRLAALWRGLPDRDSGQRMGIIRTRTGWSKATYFRALKEARALGLVPVS